MNGKQYNNVIDWTLKHEEVQSGDCLEAAKAVFKNMGVALPGGSIKEVAETLKSDDYMGWRSCTMQQAQEYANNGTAAIGISENRMVVLSAADEEDPVEETAAVMTLSETTSAYAVSDLQYYAYSYSSTGGSGGGSSGGSTGGSTAWNPGSGSHISLYFSKIHLDVTVGWKGYNNYSGTTASSVYWTSSDPDIASVNYYTGRVTAKSVGSAIIKVTTTDGYLTNRYTITVNPLLLYQTRDTEVKWFESNESEIEVTRPDLLYNDMSKSDILDSVDCIDNNDFQKFVVEHHDGSGSFYPLTISDRKTHFLNMATSYFSNNEFEPIITDMIDHFMLDKTSNFTETVDGYSIYENNDLTELVKAHSESVTYVENLEEALENCLKENGGDLNSLKYDPAKRFNYDSRREQPFVAKALSMGFKQPVFNSNSDITTGFTICLDSLQGNKVEILSFNLNGDTYSGTMRVTYYDHFGLDERDMSGNYGFKSLGVSLLEGFHQWFILQHCNELSVQVHPKPFITMVEFETSFSGEI